MGYRIEVRDRNLNRIGIVDTWISLNFTVAYCAQGTWQILIKADSDQADLFQQGGGIAIYQDGVDTPLLTGAIESFQKYWTTDQHTNVGSVYISGHDDNKLPYQRLGFPDPAKTIAQQYTAPDTRNISGAAAQAVWNELNTALGPGAQSGRRIAGLVMDSEVPTSASVTDTMRYDVVGTKFDTWMATNKDFGWRILWDPNLKELVADVYPTRDLTNIVRFSEDLGNLREFTYTQTAPSITRAIVACQGTGATRYVTQVVNTEAEAEWGIQYEVFVDRSDLPIQLDSAGAPMLVAGTTDTTLAAALQAVQDEASSQLATGAPSGNLQIYPIDTENSEFGRDYFVGDIVTAYIDGVAYSDVLRQVTVDVDDGGNTLTVAPVIGDQGTGTPLNLYSVVSDMRNRLRRIETRN